MMKNIRDTKGITLVSLVITVVILAILAGISINIATGDDLIGETEKVAEDYNEAAIYQILNTILVSERSVYDNGFITKDKMWTNIKESIENNDDLKQFGTVNIKTETDQIKVTIDGYTYTITKDKVQ